MRTKMARRILMGCGCIVAVVILGVETLASAQEPAPARPTLRVRPQRPAMGPNQPEQFDALNRLMEEASQKTSVLLEQLQPPPQDGDAGSLETYRVNLVNQLTAAREEITELQARMRDAMMQIPTQPEARLIALTHVEPTKVAEVVSIYGGVQMVPNDELKVLAVSGSADAVAKIEEAIKTLDQPRSSPKTDRNIELLVYILRGRTPITEPASNSPEAPGESVAMGPTPARLAPMIEQLKQDFGYSEFGLMNTFVLRCRNGEGAEVSDSLPASDQAQAGPTVQKLSVNQVRYVEETGSVELDSFIYGANIPLVSTSQQSAAPGTRPVYSSVSRADVGLRVDLDAPEGQDVLVGKTSFGNTNLSALFVVVHPRLVAPVSTPVASVPAP